MDRGYRSTNQKFKKANIIQKQEEETTDLKNQREYLIDKVVIGQRLALARCRFSFDFAKERAWARLVESGASAQREAFDAALNKALAAIQKNKDRIEELEEENTDISEQNEGLREGALEGMESLREMQSLQNDVAKLNLELTMKAEQVSKLLQKNKEL